MILALYVIVSTAALVWLSARLREAREELARERADYDDRARAVGEEYRAYACGVAVSLACLLAGLAAARWYAPPRARPAPGGRPGTPAGQGGEAGQ